MSETLGALLLSAARDTLHSYLSNNVMPSFDLASYPPEALEPCGAFVTLKRHGELRGCIGTIYPGGPLLEEVVHNAISAALNDSRFAPVTFADLAELTIEVSVLTPPWRLEASGSAAILAALTPLRHGVILQRGSLRSTYLPQVWQEISDKETFLDSLCRKGGMPRGAWHAQGTEIYLYEARVYGPVAASASHPPRRPAP